MENKNKCFFSISLENGIVITGENPEKVMHFLTLLESALFWAAKRYEEYDLSGLLERTKILYEKIGNANLTIILMKKNEEK